MTNVFSLLAFLIMLVTVFSCKKNKDDDPDPGSCPYGIVEVTNDIENVTTWTSDNIYIIKGSKVWVNNTLTIEPGTIIKFEEGKYLEVQQSGTIIADGKEDKPIIFTSIKDDRGCDNNGDGSASSPHPADWSRILVGTKGNIFNYCEFYYGGGNTWHSTLETRTGSIMVTNCTFAENVGGPYSNSYYGVLSARDSESGSVVTGNTFYNNVLPMTINANISLGTDNMFSKPNDATQSNSMNGIFVFGSIEKDMTWEETEVPFTLVTSTLFVDYNFSLADGVVVKSLEGNGITIKGSGNMNFSEQVIFTSYKDDSYHGDTNGDGDATSPSKGDWDGIWNAKNSANTFYLSGNNILYADNP